MEMKNHLQKLIKIATAGGASDACFFGLKELVIDDKLASMCSTPQCRNYGHSASCPPHVEGPEALRRWRDLAESALAIRIDVPVSILRSEERYGVMKMLHEVVASVELTAISLNYPGSRSFAGGSCKHIFCRDHGECLRLSEKGICRNPLHARPSMSGFGINVGMMMKAAGWEACKPLSEEDGSEEVSWVAGLVLISR
ncbi:DUF2284 domain-containing protein [Desulfopila inferna]|uniref:DUF2284 domain-containing protein n=1 Tax=Desulfopila inferna TaxID=468528 RepID=UPI0019656795|nr:DUF2284 domain-containing protein [Desulfopila inferna]MBM9606545.1 DUF2284 domain-containing protein [Desulfopila inferna]